MLKFIDIVINTRKYNMRRIYKNCNIVVLIIIKLYRLDKIIHRFTLMI